MILSAWQFLNLIFSPTKLTNLRTSSKNVIYLAFSEVATDFSRHVIKQSRVEVDSVNIMVVQPGTEYMLYEYDMLGAHQERVRERRMIILAILC